jgi:hypothetical protein
MIEKVIDIWRAMSVFIPAAPDRIWATSVPFTNYVSELRCSVIQRITVADSQPLIPVLNVRRIK